MNKLRDDKVEELLEKIADEKYEKISEIRA